MKKKIREKLIEWLGGITELPPLAKRPLAFPEPQNVVTLTFGLGLHNDFDEHDPDDIDFVRNALAVKLGRALFDGGCVEITKQVDPLGYTYGSITARVKVLRNG